MSVVHLNSENFHQAISGDKPVLVDFWATWCGPCRMQSPILDRLASDIGSKAVVAKVNVDEERDLAVSYQIMSIPALMIFKNGRPVKSLVGVTPKERLESELEKYM